MSLGQELTVLFDKASVNWCGLEAAAQIVDVGVVEQYVSVAAVMLRVMVYVRACARHLFAAACIRSVNSVLGLRRVLVVSVREAETLLQPLFDQIVNCFDGNGFSVHDRVNDFIFGVVMPWIVSKRLTL